MKAIDITGQRFGRLIALKCVTPKKGSIARKWLCFCDCGTLKEINQSALRSELTRSCGCLFKEVRAAQPSPKGNHIHGMSKSPEFWTWINAKRRCHDPNHPYYKSYGARGITMCEEWRNSFQAFFNEVGTRPKGMTLERIDNSKGYEPGNCKWATWKEQAQNKRRRIDHYVVTLNGITGILKEVCKANGIARNRVHHFVVRKGMSPQEALNYAASYEPTARPERPVGSGYNSGTYSSWYAMIQRCTNPNSTEWGNYGGRGITVCGRWRKYQAFLDDMGIRGQGQSLERRDNDQSYFLENCCWADKMRQARNRRKPKPRSS
jgi:hypothetical protein